MSGFSGALHARVEGKGGSDNGLNDGQGAAPGLVALRMKYDQANETNLAHIVHGFALLAGLYLAISPWVVGFQSLTALATVNVLTGMVLVALAFGLA